MKRDYTRWSIKTLSSHLADFLPTIVSVNLTFFETFSWSIWNLGKLCLICALSSWLIISAISRGLVLTYYPLFRFFASEQLCLTSWIPKDSLILLKVFRVVIINRCKSLLLFSIDFWEVDIIFLEFFWASSGWLFTWRIRSLLLNFYRFVSCITTSSWHIFESHLGPGNCLVILMLSISSFWQTKFENVLWELNCFEKLRLWNIFVVCFHCRAWRAIAGWEIFLDSFDNNWHF